MKNKNFISHFLIISGGTFINMLIGLLTTPIITRIVDPIDYGQLSIFNVYTNIATMVLCLGLDQALVRFFYRGDIEYQKKLLHFCVKVPLLLSFLSLSLISLFYFLGLINLEFSNFILILLCINILLCILNRFLSLVLRLTYESKKYTLTNIIQKIIYVVTTLLLVSYTDSNHFNVLAISTVIAALTSSVFIIINIKKYLNHSSSIIEISKTEIFRYSFPFIFSMGLVTLFQAIDKISLNYFCDYTEVGIYSSAMSIVNIFAIIQTSFNSLWAPMQVEHYTKNPEDKSFYEKGNSYITIVMFILGIHIILFKDVLVLLLGERYRDVVYIIPMLIFNPIMYTISETTCCGIVISKKSYLNILVSLFSCITNIIGNLILVPYFGGKGAAISTGFSYIIFYLSRTYISNKNYYVNYHLGKFSILLALLIGFSLYNTFIDFNFIVIMMYFVIMVIFALMYRNSIIDGIKLIINYLQLDKHLFARKGGENL